jgi:ABC-type ATPase involved in cell division
MKSVADGMTVVLSSHDERPSARMGAKMIYLEDGMLSGMPERLPYADSMLRAKENHADS